MREWTIQNVPVQISPGLTFTPEIQSLVTEYIRRRFATPIVAWKDDRAGKPAMRFASPAEADRCKSSSDYLSVQVGDLTGRIYTLFGLMPAQLTSEDITFAKRLWFEPVYVDRRDGGQPYIDD